MSLTRQFFREFRPLFRMLEEPFGRQAPTSSLLFPRNSGSLFADHPGFGLGGGFNNVPAVDVSEEPNAFVVEAEIPGVKKENLDVRIGDNGQSLTIEGRTFVRSVGGGPTGASAEGGETPTPAQAQAQATEVPASNDTTQSLTQSNSNSTQLSTERTFTASSSFSRTIWLPKRVDGLSVSAKLSDGILTIRVPKAEDQESVKVNIE